MSSKAERNLYKRKWASASRTVNKNSAVSIKPDFYDNDSIITSCYSQSDANEPSCTLAAAGEVSAAVKVTDVMTVEQQSSASTDMSFQAYLRAWEDSSSNNTDSENDTLNDTILAYHLSSWVSQFNIKQNAVDKLLRILQQAGHRLPSTARSLMKTSREVTTTVKSGMQYLYLDLVKKLQSLFRHLSAD